MLKNDTLKNGTSGVSLYGSPPPGCLELTEIDSQSETVEKKDI